MKGEAKLEHAKETKEKECEKPESLFSEDDGAGAVGEEDKEPVVVGVP